ncbi:hypothetical protein ACWD4N_31705 [Streptomyces sp. NPDC002586]
MIDSATTGFVNGTRSGAGNVIPGLVNGDGGDTIRTGGVGGDHDITTGAVTVVGPGATVDGGNGTDDCTTVGAGGNTVNCGM